MRFHFYTVVATLLMFSGAAQAATLVYTGQKFSEFFYQGGPSVLRGPYDSSMNISVTVEINGDLAPSSEYILSGRSSDLVATSIVASDGINDFASGSPEPVFVDLETGALGEIVYWSINTINGAPDFNDINSSSISGDLAGYYFEYALPGGLPNQTGGESASASTSAIGSWVVIPTVPLPASGLLLGFGLVLLRLVRTKR